MKKFVMIVLVLLCVAAGAAYYFRFEIFQVSAESIIKKNLPPFMFVDKLDFNLKDGVLTATGIGIKNPRGYKNKYLAHIDTVICTYKMSGKQILDGFEVTDIKANGVVINVERRPDGRLNVNEMKQSMGAGRGRFPVSKDKNGKDKPKKSGAFDISEMIKLTDTINIKNGRVNFLDEEIIRPRQYALTIDNMQAKVVLRLNSNYTDVLSVGSSGSGNINGDRQQKINWVVSLDPGSPALTMSNRIEASNLDITLLKPYYDEYSPVEIERGRFSGTIVLDFDNGDIGSMNTLRLSNLVFRQKTGFAGSMFWDIALPDMVKYLQSSPGEITFDFKIKGTMEDPRFYPGPIVKAALQKMAIDKISQLFQPSNEGSEAATGGGSDTDKIFDAIRGLLNQ
jgi:uncharacterized protein DUF748